ncbi:MAG: hypothetical protein Q4G33_09385 [bacterium]|nr:hypothetical protein [bacterium]
MTDYKAYSGRLKPEFITAAAAAYSRYKSEMSGFRRKVMDNDKWYKCNYGHLIKPGSNEPGPATAFIANAIFNRYADFIDCFPVPNILERTPDYTETAKKLRDIIPVLLDMTEFKSKYKRNCYNKMKNGSGIYGVFYNEEERRIEVTVVDILDFFCDIRIKDIQDSQFIFVRNAVDNELLREKYPGYAALFQGGCTIEGREGNYRADDRTEVIDCYYKKPDGTVHMMKLVNESVVIDATEDIEGYENGLYAHGMYPFVIDNMYPDDDNVMGFSLIDITRNPQMYIDKLDAAILKNAMLSSHPRWLIKDTGGINKKEFADMTKEVISSATDVDEKNIKMFQVNSLPSFVREHREKKIEELKEISGNRDWNNGGTTGGVTAASAIEALQNTGQKLSRANIDDTYDSYKRIIYMIIELVREFFVRKAVYRITDENGRRSFIEFSSSEMYGPERDVFGFLSGKRRRAEFDVAVVPQKENPFTSEANNRTINELWSAGYFMPQNMELSIMALRCMSFDSRDKLIDMMQEYIDTHGDTKQNSGEEAGGERMIEIPLRGTQKNGSTDGAELSASAPEGGEMNEV